MPWAIALRFWREGVIALAFLFLVQQCHARDKAIEERGRWQERARVADSVLKIAERRINVTATKILVDTVRVRHTVERVTTLRDTVLQHLTDTVTIKEFVRAADSTVRACSELTTDCAEFRKFAIQKFQADSVKLAAVRPIVQSRSCTATAVTGIILGAAGGALVVKLDPWHLFSGK